MEMSTPAGKLSLVNESIVFEVVFVIVGSHLGDNTLNSRIVLGAVQDCRYQHFSTKPTKIFKMSGNVRDENSKVV